MQDENFTGNFDSRRFLADRGVLYIAFGESFTKEASLSYLSLRRFSPDLPVCIMTDTLERLEHFEDVNLLKVKIQPQHIRAKVDFISFTPFKNTLYLDSDTVVVRNIEDIFECLSRFDVAVTHDYARKRNKYAQTVPEYSAIPYAFSEVNGGVFAFCANEKTQTFLEMWKSYFYKYYAQTNGWDQVSLRISLWNSGVSLFHMPFEYNIRSKANREKQDKFRHEFGEQHMAPRIYHMHYSPEVHQGKFEIESVEELEKSLIEQAVWY